MLCIKLCCDITIRLVTINFQSYISHFVTPYIVCHPYTPSPAPIHVTSSSQANVNDLIN
jgi:hypothetical protein